MTLRPATIALSTALLAACNPPAEPPPAQPGSSAAPTPEVSARSDRACQLATDLEQQIRHFASKPETARLMDARAAWRQAHEQYRLVWSDYQQAGLTLPQQGDDRDTLDAWPILPGYLDQVPGYPKSGLVHADLALSQRFLAVEHQSTDFHYLTRGFHPIEFLLWGEPAEAAADRVKHFVSPEPAPAIDAAQRRRQLLGLMAEDLAAQLQTLCRPSEQGRLSQALASQETVITLTTAANDVDHGGWSQQPAADGAAASEEAGQ